MANMAEAIQIAYNNATPVTATFTHKVSSYVLWTNNGDVYVEEDGTATTGSFPIPNTGMSLGIPCKTLSILGKGNSGVAYIKGIWLTTTASETEIEAARGGIHK